MFTIEHDFDATVITLIDEGEAPLGDDVIITAFEDCVTLTQADPRDEDAPPVTVTLSMAQLRDLQAALDLPEGSYRLRAAKD